jgi:hypothetical protein
LFAAGGVNSKVPGSDDETDPDRLLYGEARRNERKRPSNGSGKRKAKVRRGKDTGKPERKKAEKMGRRSNQPTGVHSVALDQVRSRVPHGESDLSRTIFFTPDTSGNVEIKIEASGLSDDIELSLAAVSVGTVVNGRLHTELVRGQRTSIQVTFSEPFSGPIELEAISLPVASQEV